MKISITLKNNQEIIADFTEQEYNDFKDAVQRKATRLIEINGEMINPNLIQIVKPIVEQQVISKEFRISEPKEEERVRVPGGFQKPSTRENMIRLFNKMKANGCFKNFNSYEQWELTTGL